VFIHWIITEANVMCVRRRQTAAMDEQTTTMLLLASGIYVKVVPTSEVPTPLTNLHGW